MGLVTEAANVYKVVNVINNLFLFNVERRHHAKSVAELLQMQQ